MTLHIVHLWQYYLWCIRSGVTDAPYYGVLPVPYCPASYTMWLHSLLGSFIGILTRLLAAGLAVPLDFYLFPSQCLWNDLADPVYDGVGLAGFKTMVIVFILS